MSNLIILFITIFTLFLYFRQRFSLTKLTREIKEKRDKDSILRLMNPIKDRKIDHLLQVIQEIFQELERIKVASQHEKAILDKAIHNITHDIRTPLTIASGYTQQLLQQSDQSGKKELVKKVLLNLKTVSERLEILMNYQNLLENNFQRTLTNVDITQSLREEIVKIYNQFLAEKFTVNLQIPEKKIEIVSDKEILQRVWQNLLGNALKHGKEQLFIEIKEEKKQIQVLFKNIVKKPIQRIDRLTTRFYSENMAESEDSSGLGLFISYELTALLNGQLSLSYDEDIFEVKVILQK